MQLATIGPRRRGFTLVELLIALVLVGIVGASVITVLIKQQRFYRSTGDMVETRSQIRQALSALPSDLRSVSSAAGDIVDMSATSIDFWATIGSGIVCQASLPGAGGLQDVYLLPLGSETARFTSWVSEPKAGDRIAVFDQTAISFTAPLALEPVGGGVVTMTPPAVACPASPFLTLAENLLDRPRLQVNVTGATPAAAGMPVRILRHVRYNLEQAPDDGQWYLAYRDFGTNGLTPQDPQIMSGPYQGPEADGSTGLAFAYFDANGNALPFTARTQVARIEVVVRALTRGSTPGSGSTRADGRLADSDRLIVGLRN